MGFENILMAEITFQTCTTIISQQTDSTPHSNSVLGALTHRRALVSSEEGQSLGP